MAPLLLMAEEEEEEEEEKEEEEEEKEEEEKEEEEKEEEEMGEEAARVGSVWRGVTRVRRSRLVSATWSAARGVQSSSSHILE